MTPAIKTKPAPTSREAKLKKTARPAGGARRPKPQPIESAPAGEERAEPERYWEAVGRRKTAVARARLFTRGDKGVWIGGQSLDKYFPEPKLQRIASDALELMKTGERFRVTAVVRGGGRRAQAEALRHATARALVLFNPEFRKRLKRAGFLRRDPRMKERKKPGLKKARRAPQWQKR